MKMNSIRKRTSLTITVTGLFFGMAVAPYQSQAQEKSEATIALSYYKKADMSKTVVATVKAKKDKKFVPAKNARVNFYVLNGKEAQLLKGVPTDYDGLATIELQKDLPLDTGRSFTIMAKIENDNLYEDAEEQVRYKEVNLTINLNPHDTSRIATALVTEMGKDGKEIPVKEAEVKFYVQRLFGILPAGEEYAVSTDEKGEASFTYPKGVSGDTAGAFTIAARIEDNEQFGNVENQAATSWGSILEIIKDPFPRAIWAPAAPWALIITLVVLFGGVWSTYCFIVFQLVKIKKEKKNNN